MKPLDRIDKLIISALQKNGRLSNKELAYQIGLAPSSCLERVRRLQQSGIFLGFHAEVNPKKLGIGLQAMVSVRLSSHTTSLVESFRAHALSLTEVCAVFHVTGAKDFILHVVVHDSDHLRELTLSAFTTRPEVDHIETSLIFEYTRNPVLPIYEEEES